MHDPTTRIAHTMALIILVVDEAEMRYNTMCPPSEIDPTTYHTMSDCYTIDLLLAPKKKPIQNNKINK